MDSVEVPATWRGSDAAYVAYAALVRAGREPGEDFDYQPRTQGRRMDLATEVDFTFRDPPGLALQVREPYDSHYSGIQTRGTDVMARAQLAGQGMTLVMLDNDRLLQDPDWLIAEALQYREHSWE